MLQGKVVRVSERGFGFIKHAGSDSDLYFHVSGLKDRPAFDQLKAGDSLEFEIDASGDRPRAVNITVR